MLYARCPIRSHLLTPSALRLVCRLSEPEQATCILGAINVGLTVLAIALMGKAGRRTLLLSSWLVMSACYLTVTFAFVGTEFLGLPAQVMHAIAVTAMAGVLVAFAVRRHLCGTSMLAHGHATGM